LHIETETEPDIKTESETEIGH